MVINRTHIVSSITNRLKLLLIDLKYHFLRKYQVLMVIYLQCQNNFCCILKGLCRVYFIIVCAFVDEIFNVVLGKATKYTIWQAIGSFSKDNNGATITTIVGGYIFGVLVIISHSNSKLWTVTVTIANVKEKVHRPNKFNC